MPNDTETTHYNVRGTDPTNNECFGVVPTPFQRFDDGALMGDVLLSAFYLAFDFLKPPLQFSAVHKVDYQEKAHRQARAFKVLQSMIGDAVRSSGHVEAQLATYLEASPRLAHYLARWQANNP